MPSAKLAKALLHNTCNARLSGEVKSTLLSIEVSPRGDRSISRALGKRFIEHWLQAHPDGSVIHRDLMEANIPCMNNDWISGVYAPPEVARTSEMNRALDSSAN